MSLKLDFDQRNSIQPTQINFDNDTGEVAFYGSAVLWINAAVYQ